MRLLALGMANDQAKVEFYRREEIPFPLSFLECDKLVQHLHEAVLNAEDTGRQLWGALSTLAVELLFHKEEATLAAERRYWAALEIPLYSLINALPDDATASRRAWAAALRRAAWSALAAIAGLG